MKVKGILVYILIASLIAITMIGTAMGKSLYVIADINSSPTPIDAYDIQPGPPYLVYQTTYFVPYHGWGGVGITIDTDAECLFITYESSNTIELIDATTMTSLGITIAPGASDLAGIVVDQEKQKVYTVDRCTANLYIYSWDPVAKTLTLDFIQILPNVSLIHGIALDEINNLLFIADRATTIVRYFNTDDWTEAGNFNISQKPAGIAVDAKNRFVYTGNPGGTSLCPGVGPQDDGFHLLSKYDMTTGIETTVDIRTLTGLSDDNVVGLTIDPSTSLLYISTGSQYSGGSDRLMVLDFNFNLLFTTDDIGSPTGLCVPGKQISYNPLNLAKNDAVQGYGINIGQTFTYEIKDSNSNPYDVTGVTIVDNLPAELDFVSETVGGIPSTGVYDPVARSVTWNIGTIPAGQAGPLIELVVMVNQNAIPGTTIYNYCTIESDQTPPTTVEGEDPDDTTGAPGNYILLPKPTLIAPLEGAIMDNGCADQSDDMIWDFVWSNCPGATQYHLYVYYPGAQIPFIDNPNITDSFYHSICSPCYVAEGNRFGWTWKVRAMIGGQWGEWSDSLTFDVEPLNSDCQNTAKIQVLPKVWYTSWGNPHTGRIRCWIGELAGGYDVTQINRSTLRLNGTVPIYGITYRIIPSWPGFTGSVLEVAFDRYSSYMSLGSVIPGNQYPVTITGEFNDGVDFSGETMITVQTALPKLIGEAEIPESFSLIQNYPNPFNPETDISYALPSDCQVNLTIYNLLGQKVKTLVNEPQTAGYKTTHWNGRDEQGNLVSSGIYFYKLNAGEYTDTKKMVMTK